MLRNYILQLYSLLYPHATFLQPKSPTKQSRSQSFSPGHIKLFRTIIHKKHHVSTNYASKNCLVSNMPCCCNFPPNFFLDYPQQRFLFVIRHSHFKFLRKIFKLPKVLPFKHIPILLEPKPKPIKQTSTIFILQGLFLKITEQPSSNKNLFSKFPVPLQFFLAKSASVIKL